MSNSQERPMYKILAEKGFFGPDDHLYVFGEDIYFDDEPNEDMQPLNDAAKLQMEALFIKLDDCARAAAKAAGRPFVERPRTLEAALAQATEDARRIQSVGNAVGVPLMRSDKKSKNTGVERVAKSDIPETKGLKGKLSIKKPA